MTSKVGIINAAFLLLGHHSVNNLGDNAGEDVKKAEALYDIYYPSLLTDSYWRFALKQSQLSELESFDEVDGYTYAFQIPNDCLSIYKIEPATQYTIFGQKLYTNITGEVKLYYTANVSEANLPNYYITYVVEKFAEIFAMPVTQKPELAQLWGQSADMRLQSAMALDSQSQSSIAIQSNPLAAAKFSYGSSAYRRGI